MRRSAPTGEKMTVDAQFAQDLRDGLKMAPDFVHAGAQH
jgi:hypothetical protein